jgi:hypothetical protein
VKTPTMDDYVKLLCTLFERFVQEDPEHESALFRYSNQMMIVLFTFFELRRIFKFKAQRRWLEEHPEMLQRLGWTSIPHRVTLSRRDKELYPVVQAFVQLVGQYASAVDARLRPRHLARCSVSSASSMLSRVEENSRARIPCLPKKSSIDLAVLNSC